MKKCFGCFCMFAIVLALLFCGRLDVRAENPAFDYTLSTDRLETTRFMGGWFSEWLTVSINDYYTLAEQTDLVPDWSVSFDDPAAFGDPEVHANNPGVSFVFFLQKAVPGDYTGSVTCSWNGVEHSVPILVHVVENPDGIPQGIGGFEDSVTMGLGESISITPEVLPEGWSALGFDKEWKIERVESLDGSGTTYWYDRVSEVFDIQQENGTFTIRSLKSGRYRLQINCTSANFSLGNDMTVIVLNEDGTEPELPPFNYMLSRDGIEMTRYLGGTDSDWESIEISDGYQYSDFIEDMPQWNIVLDDPGAFREPAVDAYDYSFRFNLCLNNASLGDYTGTLTCTWNGVEQSVPLLIHVIENPFGNPEGISGIGGRDTLALGESRTYTLGALPEGWNAPGFDTEWTLYYVQTDDGVSYWYSGVSEIFEVAQNENVFTVRALKPGRYMLGFGGRACNYEFTAKQWITVLNEDGSEPEAHPIRAEFEQETITVRAGEEYAVNIHAENIEYDDIGINVSRSWMNSTEFTEDAENMILTCRTDEPGTYSITLSVWDDYRQENIRDYVLIYVTDEEGSLPELQDIVLTESWPITATVGDSWDIACSWWGTVAPVDWRMEVEHNGELRVYDQNTKNFIVIFNEKGEYILRTYITDATGRSASIAATAEVTDPSPLKAESLDVKFTRPNGENYDVWMKLIYSGGQHAASYHYQVYRNDGGTWNLIQEEDSVRTEPYFLLSPGKEYYVKAQILDGVTTEEIASGVFTVGAQTLSNILILPEALTEILPEAFENNMRIQAVSASGYLRRIGARAFAGCTALKKVYLPSGITEIDPSAFEGIEQLTVISDSADCEAERFAEANGYEFLIGDGL